MNKKLNTIASFIDKDDVVIDIGCDHAYLAIYLKKNNLCRDVYASDINCNALNIARKNIEEAHLNITAYLSDGFQNVDLPHVNTSVIAGVGASTIKDIMKYAPTHVNKFIISSNNNHDELRKYLYQNKYYIQKEVVINEKGKYYVIMLVTRVPVKESRLSLKYGKSMNQKYFQYLLDKEIDILSKIPNYKLITRLFHKKTIKELKHFIEKNEDYSC